MRFRELLLVDLLFLPILPGCVDGDANYCRYCDKPEYRKHDPPHGCSLSMRAPPAKPTEIVGARRHLDSVVADLSRGVGNTAAAVDGFGVGPDLQSAYHGGRWPVERYGSHRR